VASAKTFAPSLLRLRPPTKTKSATADKRNRRVARVEREAGKSGAATVLAALIPLVIPTSGMAAR